MALDGAFLYAVRQELSGLIGSRIEKIHQPAREEILISLRNMEGSHKILISASADRARVHLTQQSIDNPPAPPMFCMLLRNGWEMENSLRFGKMDWNVCYILTFPV